MPTDRFVVREVTSADAPALSDLINAIIDAGGTTAREQPYTPQSLDDTYLTGPAVHCCHVAVDSADGEIVAFQTLVRHPDLPGDIGDIATYARVDRKQSGAGSALFAATRSRASDLDLTAINARIRADNVGGLAFYTRQGFVDHHVAKAVPLADGTPVDRVYKRFPISPLDS